MTDAQTEARAIVRSASPTVRKLFDAIRESGSSEPDIADAAGVSHATLHYWRAGNRSPTIMLLEAVASVLGYNIELVKADHATALAAKDAELAAVRSERDAIVTAAVNRGLTLEAELAEAVQEIERLKNLVGDPEGTAAHAEAFLARAERAEAQLAEARKALEPFAWIGQWLFARDLPDETPVVMVEGAGKPFALTRGMFKAAHTTARRALEAQGGEDVL